MIKGERYENEQTITTYCAAYDVALVGCGRKGKRRAGNEMAQVEVENASARRNGRNCGLEMLCMSHNENTNPLDIILRKRNWIQFPRNSAQLE